MLFHAKGRAFGGKITVVGYFATVLYPTSMQEVPNVMGFTSGEISPWLSTRFDLQAYQRGAALLKNFIVQPYGGVCRRRGTVFVNNAADSHSGVVKFFPFAYSESDTLMLEVFSGGMRVYKNGELIKKSNGGNYVLATPWITYEEVLSLRFTQINDVIYATTPHFQPVVLRRYADNDWDWEMPELTPFPRETYSMQRERLTVDTESNGLYASVSLPDNGKMKFYSDMNGAEYLIAEMEVPSRTLFRNQQFTANITDLPDLSTNSVAKGNYLRVKSADGTTYQYYTCIRQYVPAVFNGSLSADDYPAYFMRGIMWLDAGNPYEICSDWELKTHGEWEADWEIWRSYDTQALSSDIYQWNWTRIKSFSQSSFADRQNWALSGSENAPCRMVLVCLGSKSLPMEPMLSFTALGGTREYKLLIEYVRGDYTARASLQQSYLGGNQSFTTYKWSFGAFGSRNGYPSFSCFHQGRLWLSGIKGLPTTLLASGVDDYYHFGVTSEDDSALHLTLASDNQSRICWMCATRQMLVGTSDSEWVLSSSGSSSEVLTPSGAAFMRHSSVGSEAMPVHALEHAILFLQRGGSRLREISYKLESDGFASTDTSLLAEHLFASGVKEWCVQRGSNFYVWVLMNDGTVALLTMNPEQKVVAWQRVAFEGREVLHMAAVQLAHSSEDEMWFAIKNNKSGYVSIERSAGDSPFVDGGRRVTAVEAGKLTGLFHLAGLKVCVARPGETMDVHELYEVSDIGELAYPSACVGDIYDVGVPYASELQTMPLETHVSFNSVREHSRVRLRLLESDLQFDYKASHVDRWEHYSPDIDAKPVPYTGSVRLTQMPNAGIGQGFCLRYSGNADFKLLSLTVEVDFHGK